VTPHPLRGRGAAGAALSCTPREKGAEYVVVMMAHRLHRILGVRGMFRRVAAVAALLVLVASTVLMPCPCPADRAAATPAPSAMAHHCCHSGPALRAAATGCCMTAPAKDARDVTLPSPVAVAAPTIHVVPFATVEPQAVIVAVDAPVAPASPHLVLRI
jgi:hypothetical protein